MALFYCINDLNRASFSGQEKEWQQYEINVSRKTMANWIICSSQSWLEPIYERFRLELNKQDAINADETPYQTLNRPDGRPASSDARIWLFQTNKNSPRPISYYHSSLTRARSNIDEVLSVYDCYLHCDGYSAYQNMPNLKVVACWAHVRRKFFEAGDERGMAAIGKNYCDQLFALEQQFKKLSADARKAYRQLKSKPLLDEFWEWIGSFPVIAKSKLGRAIAYAQNLKDELMTFLDDGNLVISNNLAERQIRPLTIGRKNFMFSTKYSWS
ncbi:IS66 family transposase [Vagococcus silagei]|nr:IS66 family transposase [Vagococcus silagei]